MLPLANPLIQPPAMRRLGDAGDPDLTRDVGRVMARELVATGFNINFAPVADVDSNPNNPVIGDRAFSGSPQMVVQHARAMLEAFQAAGLMACIKHFPGHGDTDHDSHFSLPIVRRSTVQLREVEMYPFERLARHAATLMTAHVVFEAFDSLPATFSTRLLSDLLRREFAFEGVVFSDDLEMAALAQHWPLEESAVRAVEAGCDALLVCHSKEGHERAERALMARVDADPAFRSRCVDAVSQSVGWRRKFAPAPLRTFEELQALVASANGRRVRERLAALVEAGPR